MDADSAPMNPMPDSKPMADPNLLPSDKLREECGVVAIHNHPDAARQDRKSVVRERVSDYV